MSNKVEANNRQAPPPDRTRAEAMKRKLLLAAIALVSLSGFALADDIHSRAGTWDVVSAGKFVLAHSDSAIARSEDRATLTVACVSHDDGTTELVVRVSFPQKTVESRTVTYQIAHNPQVTGTWNWPILKPDDRTGLNLNHDALAFVRSLPTSGKMMVRVGLQDGPAEATFDLNGIDEVRQTLDDVCKLNPASSGH
jgi:hypothetical protein